MNEISLSTIANLAEIIGVCTIVTGVLIGLSQIRLHRQQQQNAIATQLTQTFLSPDLADAIALVRTLPDDVPAEELRARGAEVERAAIVVTTSFETMGLMVYRGIAPIDFVLDLAGGILVVMWRKTRVWHATVREEQAQPSWAEWFEWLASRSVTIKGGTLERVTEPAGGAPASLAAVRMG